MRKITPQWKEGWVLLSFASPSVIHDGQQYIDPYEETHVPHDMPWLYLAEVCHFRNSRDCYEGISYILKDGWEPVSVGERLGGPYGHGRLHSFKKLVRYTPGLYLKPDERG